MHSPLEQQSQSEFYDGVWAIGHVWRPQAWPEWSIIAPHLAACPRRLEIGAGLRPRLPIGGTLFVEISPIALGKLADEGGRPLLASATCLPLPNRSIDMLAACEILEHLEDDAAAFAEIARVLSDDGWFFFSVPLQPALWTKHDTLAGHYRRYELSALADVLTTHGFRVEAFSPGVAGGYSALKTLGAWFFGRFPQAAIWLEDRITLPLGARTQKSIRRYTPSLPANSAAPSAFIACRRLPR